MNKEFRRAAERMLARATALGLTTKTGAPAVVDLMEELLAASQGYRNAHAARAALAKQDTPETAASSSLKERHLTLAPGQDCWLTLGAFVVHPNLTDEGIVVDVYAKGATDETIASTWAMQDDAEAALCEQECIDLDDVADWASQQGQANFDSCSLAERWALLEQFVQSQQHHHRLAGLLTDWKEVLEELGYEFTQEMARAGDNWRWTAPTDASEDWFASEDEAIAAAWRDACAQAMAVHQMAAADWDALPFQEHARLLRALMD